MKTRKTALALILALALIVSLAACYSGAETGTQAPASNPPASTAPASSEPSVEPNAEPAEDTNAATVFFGGEIGDQGGSGVKIELFDDETAKATYGYFVADGTCYAEYSVTKGTWAETDGTYSVTFPMSVALDTPVTYTGTQEQGFTVVSGDMAFDVSYRETEGGVAFFGGEIGNQGGSGALVALNEDNTASLTFGYFTDIDGVANCYATYTAQSGTWTEADGTYIIEIITETAKTTLTSVDGQIAYDAGEGAVYTLELQ